MNIFLLIGNAWRKKWTTRGCSTVTGGIELNQNHLPTRTWTTQASPLSPSGFYDVSFLRRDIIKIRSNNYNLHGNAAVIIVNICKYAIWDWHDQSLVLSKIRNDIAKWTILFSQMVYITLQYRLYHFVISSILQCCQYTLTTLLIYFCNQLRLLSKQNCVRCWLFQNLLLLHFNQSFHLFRTIPAIILILKFAATLPPIFWNALFMGKNGWQHGGSRWQQVAEMWTI